MKKILIFGSGDHSKVILSEVIQIEGYEAIGFIDENIAPGTIIETINDKKYKILGNTKSIKDIIDSDTYGIIGIGLNYLRKKVFHDISALCTNIRWANIISKNSIINGKVEIGEGTIVLSGSIINTGTSIGNHCIINTKSSIDHDNILKNYSSTGPGTITGGNVTIGECSHLGIGCTINQNITIGSNTIIGAQSLCVKNCDNNSVYYGTPAKRIRDRESDENYF